MKLALVEVYEVASFYAHFDIVMDGETPPPPLTVRVCDSLTCELHGRAEAAERAAGEARRRACAWCARPAWAAATTRRWPRSATRFTSTPRSRASPSAVAGGRDASAHPRPIGISTPIARTAATSCWRPVSPASDEPRRDPEGARGFAACAASAAPAFRPGANGASCCAEPKPRLMAVNADEGEPGTFKDRYYLETDPHRFLEGMLIGAWVVEAADIYIYLRDEYPQCREILLKEIAKLEGAGPSQARAHPPAPRRRRLYLRRGIGDAGEHRGQARPAAPQAALSRPGRAVRPPDADQQRRDAVLGARHRREGRRHGSRARAATAARGRAASRSPAASRIPA